MPLPPNKYDSDLPSNTRGQSDNFDKHTYASVLYRITYAITKAYELVLEKDYPSFENNEEKITGKLVRDFLDNTSFRHSNKLQSYRFIPEPAELDEEYKQIGYHDIRVIVSDKLRLFEQGENFGDRESDYIIECKRIDGTYDLNKKYLTHGIHRFTSGKYGALIEHKYSIMVGYVVGNISISTNIGAINQLIDDISDLNTSQVLTHTPMFTHFSETYVSKHNTYNGKSIELHHLMLNVSSKITVS
jgi:hypothetical protein